jgi:protein-tyrosine phosphatase
MFKDALEPSGIYNTAHPVLVGDDVAKIYIGDYQYSTNVPKLVEQNIKLVINVSDIAKPLATLHAYQSADIEHVWYSTRDSPDYDIVKPCRLLHKKITTFLESHAGAATTPSILVHCAAGISRSASVLIYHIMQVHAAEFDTALAYVKEYRPQVEPNYGFAISLRALGPDDYRRQAEATESGKSPSSTNI